MRGVIPGGMSMPIAIGGGAGSREGMPSLLTGRDPREPACFSYGFESDGFIHCSTREQVLPVAASHFCGRSGLVLVEIEPAFLTAGLRFEPAARAGGVTPPELPPEALFPHVYGPIALAAVVRASAFEPGPDGTFSFAGVGASYPA